MHIKLIGDLPHGSGALEEARVASFYLAKYVSKSLDDERRAAGLHRYEVAQGFQPHSCKRGLRRIYSRKRTSGWAGSRRGCGVRRLRRVGRSLEFARVDGYRLFVRGVTNTPGAGRFTEPS